MKHTKIQLHNGGGGGIKHIDCLCNYFEAVSYRCRVVVIL